MKTVIVTVLSRLSSEEERHAMREQCQKLWDEKLPTLYREALLFAVEMSRKPTIVRALDQD